MHPSASFIFYETPYVTLGNRWSVTKLGTETTSKYNKELFFIYFSHHYFGQKPPHNLMKTIFFIYRIYSRIGRNFFLIFFNKKHGCDLSARHTLKFFGYCKYRIFRLISRYTHELRLRLCSHIPMRDSFMRAHAHGTAQRALDFPALLRKNGFAILMFDFEVICF